jgi:hypothetical protein
MLLRKNIDHGRIICWKEEICGTTESNSQLKHSDTRTIKRHMNGQNLHSTQTSSEAQRVFYSICTNSSLVEGKSNEA